jgi:hypothetical protein
MERRVQATSLAIERTPAEASPMMYVATGPAGKIGLRGAATMGALLSLEPMLGRSAQTGWPTTSPDLRKDSCACRRIPSDVSYPSAPATAGALFLSARMYRRHAQDQPVPSRTVSRSNEPRGRGRRSSASVVGEAALSTRRARGVLHLGIGRDISRHNEAPPTYSRATGRRRSSVR